MILNIGYDFENSVKLKNCNSEMGRRRREMKKKKKKEIYSS
jgi:hypothetical protein